MSRFTTIPNKKYWGVFDLSRNEPICVALFIYREGANEWIETGNKRAGMFVIQECFAQVSVQVSK